MTAPPRSEPDDRLVALALAGDALAFETLVERHRAEVVARALGVTRSVDEAEDLAQEVFLRAYRSLGRLRHGARFRGWILGIARHLAIDHLRAAAQPGAALPGDVGAARDLREDGRGEELSRALAAIPEKYRAAVVMRHMDGLDYPELAARLDLSEAAARQRVKRGLDRLRRILGPELERGER